VVGHAAEETTPGRWFSTDVPSKSLLRVTVYGDPELRTAVGEKAIWCGRLTVPSRKALFRVPNLPPARP
jgi:hypothetical protein